jgi:hypothetical protein
MHSNKKKKPNEKNIQTEHCVLLSGGIVFIRIEKCTNLPKLSGILESNF